MRKLLLAILAGTMTFSAVAQPASKRRDNRPIGEMTLHDFAAKWMMQQDDLADVGRYRAANQALIANPDGRRRIVLLGDSITFQLPPDEPRIPGAAIINRGISGQNSNQMLLRFEEDVIALQPVAVVILAGTNDLHAWVGDPAKAGTAMTARIMRNITAMSDIADARKVRVVLATIPPIGNDPRLERDPATILRVNRWLKEFAGARGYPLVDYHALLAGSDGMIDPTLTEDALHPNPAGQRRMLDQLQLVLTKVIAGLDRRR